MEKIFAIFNALKAGEELKDPAKWKKGQNLTNLSTVAVVGLVASLRLAGVDLPMDDEQLKDAGAFVALGLALINSYLTTATSKKVGVK